MTSNIYADANSAPVERAKLVQLVNRQVLAERTLKEKAITEGVRRALLS